MKKNLYFRALYGVEQKVFNVGVNGVKTHWNPITNREYAYGSSANVKHNLKELFSDISSIVTPKTEFSKVAKVEGGKISINEDGAGEQGGVSIAIDVENPICSIFGAWTSEVPEGAKYAKAALKSNIMVADMMPIHSLLQQLSKSEKGVFCGDANSSIVLAVGSKKDKTLLKTPEEAAEFANCSIEDAKKAFASVRPMNLYEDKRTATGLYKADFAIELDTFGKIKVADITSGLSDEKINELVSKGWREMEINGEKYLSPSKEDLIKVWEYLVDALLNWDFTSNNSLHGSVKEALRYSMSLNAQKLNQCTTATMYCDDEGKAKAKLALRESKEVYSFNTTNLEKWHVCDGSDGNTPIKTNIDADYEARELLIQIGKDNIL